MSDAIAKLESALRAAEQQLADLKMSSAAPAQAAVTVESAIIQQILQRLEKHFAAMASPWLDRKGAAAHLRCSTQEIDSYRHTGKLKTHWRGTIPMFKKADLDRLIENGQAPKVRRGRKPKTELKVAA